MVKSCLSFFSVLVLAASSTLVASDVSLTAPAEGEAGTSLLVYWTGPNNEGDYVTIVEKGAREGSWESYVYTRNGNPSLMSLPAKTGEYEIRYADGKSFATLARSFITVKRPEVKIFAPDSVGAGTEVSIEWVGPNGTNDFLTVVPVGTREGAWKTYKYTREGSPLTMRMPDETGAYEIRYAHGSSYATMAKRLVNVMDVSATVKVNGPVVAGEKFTVDWLGPDNQGDFLTIVRPGAREGSWGDYVYTRRGTPADLVAPLEPGKWEIRYAMGQSYTTLARQEFDVLPGTMGKLKVQKLVTDVEYSAIEIVLDASGSMLKKENSKPRYEIAAEALENFIYMVPPGRQVAIRAFGHIKINSCDTRMELPLQPLEHFKAVSAIKGIVPKQLAKTPIADSISRVAGDLSGVPGKKLVILVTDGEETCGGNVATAMQSLVNSVPAVTIHVVGFEIDEQVIKANFEKWAGIGGGTYFDAGDSSQLGQQLGSAVQPVYKVLGGERIYVGTMNESELELPAGEYLLFVDGGEQPIEKMIEITPGETLVVNL